MSWEMVALGEIAEIDRTGVSPDTILDGTVFLGLENIESGGRILGRQEVGAGEIASTKFQFGSEHILYGKLRPYLAKIALPDFEGVCSTDILPILPGREIDKTFLAFYLRQPFMVDHATMLSTGANLPRLSPNALANFQIPLPPLEEQKRIASILDQADSLRRSRAAALEKLNGLGQAIFYEMFGDPAINQRGWVQGTIGDLLDEVKYGTSSKANTDGCGLPILRMGNVTYDGRIDLADLKHIELNEAEFQKYTTQKGDILFNRTNSKDLVGKTAVVHQTEPMAIAGYLVRARVGINGNPEYISAYLNSPHGKAVLKGMCKNIVGMANINANEFQTIKIALPPVKTQNEFADRIAMVERQRLPYLKSHSELDTLFASLQHRAFRGEL